MRGNILRIACIVCIFLVTSSTFAADDDYIVATVGDEKIYFSEIQKAAQGLNRFLKENFETSKNWRLDYIRQYVARLALSKRAKREGIDKNKDVLFTIEQARRNILSDIILTNRLAKIAVSEDNLQSFYEQNKAKYQIKEKIKISYIKVKAKKEAERIVSRLNKGTSFKKIGRRKIVKINDWISKGAPVIPGLEKISPEALNSLFTIGVGGSSQSIKIKDEFYIFQIEEKELAKDRPFEEVRKQVEFEYSKKVRDEAINKFIMETFSQEKVRMYEDRVIKGVD